MELPHGAVHLRLTTGARSGVPLLMLHQAASASEMFDRVTPSLARVSEVIAPDLPGFGSSDPLPGGFTVDGTARVVATVLDRLGVPECDVFGHHTGASVAAQFAADRPDAVRRLILSGPPLVSSERAAAILAGLRPTDPVPDGAHLEAVWDRIGAKEADVPLELRQRETLLTLLAGRAGTEAYHAVFSHDLGGALGAIRCPTLVCAGPDDSVRDSLEEAAALIPGAEVAVLPAGGTYVCDRHPEAVATLILDFLGARSAT